MSDSDWGCGAMILTFLLAIIAFNTCSTQGDTDNIKDDIREIRRLLEKEAEANAVPTSSPEGQEQQL